jgi:hypothetical protein
MWHNGIASQPGVRLVQIFALDEELAAWHAELAQLQGPVRLDS